jgi:hypothetical protein
MWLANAQDLNLYPTLKKRKDDTRKMLTTLKGTTRL